ncbi:MAG: FAD-dependent oxidoreductase [Victivallaceae bacterium]|nr:FAD-dependent oxidoreductase [Victivallaceae bacterium]MDD4318548.1 FAD-dependent oxidoreductase [Victivallaceae bacterium]
MNNTRNVCKEIVDVAVVGGGTAGVIAALQSAREGARTVLFEMTGKLGGTITSIPAPAYFYSRYKQIIKGIGWELILANKKLDNIPLPDFLNPSPIRPSYHVFLNPHIYALIAEDECLKSKVVIHYHETVVAVERCGDEWELTTVGKNIERTIRAKEIIDCTGDADIVGMLNLPRQRGETRQPGTLSFKITGYDIEQLDGDLIENKYRQALADGTIRKCDFCFNDKPFIHFLKCGGMNQQHIIDADSSSSITQTEANIEAHQSLLRMFSFIRQLPGCEKASLDVMGSATSIRESWRIVGEKTITYEDYINGKLFDDAVAFTLYFIDIHHEDGITREFLPYDKIPSIPLGALIPRGSRGIMVAGRCLSSDQVAFSALRVQASCMAMGQAAGATAALAVKMGVASRDVPLSIIRETLKMHNAIVPYIDQF